MIEQGLPVGPRADAFGDAAEHLRALADEMSAYPRFKSPAKSPASREARDRSLDGVWGRATFELLHDPAPRISVVTDHLRAIAAVTDEPETVLSTATLVRPILETLGTLWWLYDPEIDTRERVRRRYNIRLASLVEQWNIASTLDGASRSPNDAPRVQVEDLIGGVEESARTLGFRFVSERPRFDHQLGGRYLDSRMPTDAKLITNVVESGEVRGLGRLIHRLTSAVIHGQAHALLPFIVDRTDTKVPGVSVAHVGMTLGWYAILTAPAVLASNVTMHRLIGHFGWPAGRWDRVAQPAVAAWRDWLTAP